MAIRTCKAEAQLQQGMRVKAASRTFEITIDEPVSLGGTNMGMTPAELVLCALGACQSIVAQAYAKKFGIPLDDYRVELEGDIDSDGYKGLSEVRSGYLEIRYDVYVRADASRERLEEFVRFIEGVCPVGDSLANPVLLVRRKVIIDG